MEQNIVNSLDNNYMPYAVYVILQRALPEIDGFKPSQRRILYTMHNMGLLKGNRKKSQGIVGQTMFLHPHGDGAIYETMVRMARDNESLLIPYIDSKGNFGKYYSRDMQYAASRYTEAKLTDVSRELFDNINKNNVDMVDNYDGTLKEPRLLPVTFPTILVNSQSGTAVGMASNIPSFNINEIIDYTIAYIQNSKVDVSDYIKAPDFSTGGAVVYDENVFNNVYNNGTGSLRIRATYEIEDNSIIFKDIPYTTTFEAIIDKISLLVKEGKIKDITDINDIYGIDSKGIEIIVKNNTNKELLIEKLFKLTTLEDTFSCNMNIIVNGRPKVLGVKDIIHEWVVFRANTVKRGLEFDKSNKTKRKHLLTALKSVLLDVDKAISIIKDTKKNSEVVEALMVSFSINEEQAEFVADIKLRHLNEEYLLEKISEIEKIDKELEELDKVINNKSILAKLIIKQLKEIKKKYGQERKTEIIKVNDIPKINIEKESVSNHNVKVFITKEHYIKKIPLTSLRANNNIKVKDGDEISSTFDITNDSDIIVFTNKRNAYKYKLHELEDHKPSVLGDYLPSLLSLEDEDILFVTVTNDYKGNIIFGYDDGKVAKVSLSSYITKTNRAVLRNAYADKEVLYINFVNEDEDIDILAVSTIDKAVIFNTSISNVKTSKTAIGTNAMKQKNDSLVKGYYTINEVDEVAEYYQVKSSGIGKYLREGDFNDIIK